MSLSWPNRTRLGPEKAAPRPIRDELHAPRFGRLRQICDQSTEIIVLPKSYNPFSGVERLYEDRA